MRERETCFKNTEDDRSKQHVLYSWPLITPRQPQGGDQRSKAYCRGQ